MNYSHKGDTEIGLPVSVILCDVPGFGAIYIASGTLMQSMCAFLLISVDSDVILAHIHTQTFVAGEFSFFVEIQVIHNYWVLA